MADPEPIAIIGMGCRFPGNVGSPEDMWRLLSKGGSGWRLVPTDRWNADAFYHPDATSIQAYNTKSGYFLTQDVADFDSRFFGFGSHEADVTDPQQRILLETTYEALENAGLPIESLKGSDTAVFAALFARDYDRMGYKNLETLSKFHIGGTGEAIIANRISHFFDLRGISMTIDTGCSGSLVALHEACIALRTGQSRMAIVGGTEILLHPDQNVSMSSGGMLNSEGKCFTFDSRGAGYGRGEGVASVVVKRLKDALQDGDTVHAVIRNSGANQDGKTNGVTLPNPDAQEALIRTVYKAAHLDPQETLYVEAHGTGTEVGDNAEAQSLGNVFGKRPRARNLYVGSVKTNIGHLEAASGLAGLIKAVLVLKKQQIPPNLNYIEPKPGLRLDERQISVPLELIPLVPEGETGAVRVSLNSFGYGGTNCHVILESLEQFISVKGSSSTNDGDIINGAASRLTADASHVSMGSKGITTANGTREVQQINRDDAALATGMPMIFPLSASSEAALDAMPGQIRKWLADREISDSDLRDLSYTLACRRSKFKWRKAFVASDLASLTAALSESKVSKTRAAPSANIAFIFTGQGAQWAGMGSELIASSQTFKKSIEESSRILKDLGCEWDLVLELSRPSAESRINESELAQPTTTILQMALVDMLAQFGVSPRFVVGHSSGEIAAAYTVGALTREGAIMCSFFRGRYSAIAKKLNVLPGSMLATGYGEQAALQTLKAANLNSEQGRVTVACVNSPASTTLSGDEPAIDYIQDMLIAGGVFARKLKVETAYHSHHMEKVTAAYLESVREVTSSEAQEDIEFFSSVTGAVKKSGFGPTYWVENLVSQVRFSAAMTALVHRMADTGSHDAANILIEIGPHSALQGPINQILSAQTIPGFKSSYVAPLSRGKNSADSFLPATARLFELGAKVDFQSLFTRPVNVVGDLLPYPWDHRVKHWAESRLSRDHRLRHFPYHDLLGVYDVMSPIEEPRWRHHLSVQRLPWLKDHVVDGMVIFPGAGYSTMGVEAMKQLVQMQNPGSEIKISKTIMRDVRIARPIILPVESTDGPGEDIEVQSILSPSKVSENSPWYSVRILSLQPDQTWAEHVSGTIRVELESAAKPEGAAVFSEEHNASIEEAFEALERIQSQARERMDMKTFYDDRRAAGNDWGPSFALLSEAYIGPGVGFSKLNIPDMAQWMPFGYFQPHLIHPTTLDASNHMLPAIFHREIINAPLMPVTTEESVFYSRLSSTPGDEMVVAMELKPEGKSAARGNAWAFQHDPSTGKLALVSSVRGLLMRAVGEEASPASSRPFERKHNYQVYWNDDPKLLTKSSFARLVQPHVAKGSAFLEQLSTTEKATTIYLGDVKEMPMIQAPETAPLPHLCEFSRWISNFVHSDAYHEASKSLCDDERTETLDKSARSGIEGEMLGRIGRNLPAILTNDVNPLELLVADNLLERFYKEGPFKPLYMQMVQYMGLLTNKNPRMDVLEIGAGTGSATLPLFIAMGDNAPDLIRSYTYTDISSGFFETAKDRLDRWKSVIDYKTLDISKDPAEQGFKANTYDVVVASNVLHATRSMRETMAHVRKLLKPGGKLLLVEVNRSTAVVSRILGTIFGTLPGWWEFEDGRKDSPLLTNAEWHELLLATSFGGVEFASPDCDGPLARTSFIVAKAIKEQAQAEPILTSGPVSVIFNPVSPVGHLASDTLSSAFRERGLSSDIYTWNVLPDVEQYAANAATYVVLDSANSTVLGNPSPAIFGRFQNLLVNCRNVLWITFQEEGGPHIAPIKALVSGLARVVRRENEGIKFITVEVRDLVHDGDDGGRLVQEVLRISQLLLSPEIEHQVTDDEEFVLSGDRFLIPRVYADKQFNQWTDLVNGRGHLSPRPFKDTKHPLRMEIGAPGLLSSIHFVPDPVPDSPLGSEEIQIDSKAFGINFRDVFVALGQLSLATFMGECTGVITAVGPGEFVQSTYKVGDRVVGMHAQPFASYSRLSGYEAHVLPDNVSFAEAASIQVVFTTVYYSLVNVARLEPGQTVLIHAGSGGVGQAAIQLARHLGAEVFVTVGSEEKKKFLISDYGIPESHILSSRASPSDFKRHLMRVTENRGIDVMLNSTSGEMLAESWDCVASFGYHIELGKADIDKGRYISMAPFKRNVTFASVDLVVISRERPKVFYQVLDKVIALFSQGVLKPVHPLNIFSIDRLESAFRLISERKHLGKVVLDFGDDTMVQAALPSPPNVQLKRDGTYIIAGGLGDIGRMLVKHLTMRGAGHVVTLSRRNLADEERVAWEAEVEKLGARLHVMQCDITDNQSIQKTAEYCRQSLPPVRGLFHAGMVLKDRPLAKMTAEEWNSVLAPKVFGTWNLDKAFSSPDLDFFVTLASLAGTLGNPGQSNYSAANAFQDYFVTHHERINPTRYVSVDLPLVDETSAIVAMKAENRDFVGKGSILFDVGELLQLMDYAMNPSIKLNREFFHSLMGFDRQSMKIGSGDYVWAAMFRTIPRLQASDSNDTGNTGIRRDVEGLLLSATTFEEAVKVITETTIEKFVAFLNLEPDDVGPHQALSSFGLDSLVSIELKNWMVRTFKVTLQASELTSAPSITHLAETLASRSKIISVNLTKQAQTQESRQGESAETQRNVQDAAASEPDSTDIKDLDCCTLPTKEARQPVPNLGEAMENHIRNIAHFALNDDEVENLRMAVEDFKSPDSTGRQVYKEIHKDSRDPNLGNWVSRHLAEDFHLRMRQALQYTNFMAINHPSPVPHTQAERAALLAVTAFQLKKDIDNGTVEALFIMDTPVCRAPLQWLFNTYRRPQIRMDEMIKGVGDYCVVFRRGRLFQVPLQDEEPAVSFDRLRSAMTAILEQVHDEGSWAGILTSDNRDSWARTRDELLAVSPVNAHYFQTIEAAAFAINLDDSSPVTYADQAKQCKLGDGFNRWNDKPLQFVITANGNSGVIVEHSYLDGTTPAPLYDRIRDAIAACKPSATEPPKTTRPQEIPLILPSSFDAHIAVLRERWLEASASRDFVSYELPTLGAHLLGQNKVPIKGGYDLLCQLALYLYHGRRVIPNWQPVMLAHFHAGRHDMVQLASEPVRAFCEAAAAIGEDNVPAQRKRALMLEAARDVSRRVSEAKDGRGFYRLFTVMEQQWPAGVPKAGVFDDPLLKRGMDFTAVTNINHASVESVTTPLDPSVLRLRYTIRDDHTLISLNCPVGTAEKLIRSVNEAAVIIRELSVAK
ncbi:related to polyketide synthase [Cephalotrichum gorgonifer]|uniref:Related to polyketide synthase n=1 Tax=Cephalotrichum gorgonifer TaxID=2041049 RepID=A0AAE8N7K2_9PEZI|nr:related to polyketide synthase [Cephalotrichum gorgonifer]